MPKSRLIVSTMVLALILSSIGVGSLFAQDGPGDLRATDSQLVVQSVDPAESKPIDIDPSARFASANGEAMVSVIVKLDVAPVSSAASARAGAVGVNVYRSYVNAIQGAFEANAELAIPQAQIINRYDVVFGGVSMILPEGQLETLAKLPGVVSVISDQLQQIDTERSPQFIGAPSLWRELGGQRSAGEGVIVGVLDTGIWPEHPSFSDPDPSGKPYAPPPVVPGSNGFGSGGPRSTCDFGNTAWDPNDAPFSCNNKLIGAYNFLDTYKVASGLLPGEFDSARDSEGHGTHTASTAAGNGGVDASIFGVPRGTVSGVAPRAHVIMYRVCGDEGCYNSDSIRAVQQAVLDEADVVNFSIGGGSNPYTDGVSLAFLDAYAAGTLVSASAGNSGPGANTVGHREPWTITVGASNTDRFFISTVTLEADNGDTLVLEGASVTDGISTPTPVIFPPAGLELCGTNDGPTGPFAPGTFNGEIVICRRGSSARVTKSRNVRDGGGGGMLLYNPVLQGLATDNHFIPSVHLENDAGAALLTFMGSHTGVMATFTQGTATKVQGDVMAAFSSRGGPAQPLGISKPDVTAPGVQILAGHTPLPHSVVGGLPGELFQAIQGTSMSAPHVTGAVALLKDLHPDWTPGQLKSALMTTAKDSKVYKEDGVTPANPFDMGSGRINLRMAWDPGFTISDSAANFVALQDDLWNANYPSVYHPDMPGQITVYRTVHSELDFDHYYSLHVKAPNDLKISLEPADHFLDVPAGGDATFSITIDARNVPLGEVRHATIILRDSHGDSHLPVTIVRGEANVTIDKNCDPADFSKKNGHTTCTVTIENTSFDDAQVNLVDEIPWGLDLVTGSVVGADVIAENTIGFNGTLAGAGLPVVDVNTAPLYGYLPLSAFGIAPLPCPSNCDDGGFVISGLNINYLGQTYTSAILSVNGTLELGTASGVASSFLNQNLPSPSIPNNVLAPWWTDLNLGAGGNWYLGALSDGVSVWDIFEWAGVPRFGDNSSTFSFQIWLERGSGNITFTYGPFAGDTGDGTTGAENADGTIGDTWYFDGAGTLPWGGPDLGVASVPGTPGETHVISFDMTAWKTGKWQNCAEMTSNTFQGVAISCFNGTVTR